MSDACKAGRSEVAQCKSCPWRVDCEPDKDIPRYKRDLHKKLARTIQSGTESLFARERHVMACHYSEPGQEFACAGWLANQLGPGNNIGLRLQVASGRMPVPRIDGEQHERFEDTIPDKRRRARR